MDFKIKFLGAVQNVTGSRHLLEFNGSRVLIDCGLYQERDFQSRNWEDFGFMPADLDAVLLTHAHLDHCGLIPKLVKEGFKGKVYCTPATAELAKIVMMDSGKLQEEDAAFKRKRHKNEGRVSPRPIEPLYTMEEAEKSSEYFQPVPFAQVFSPVKGIDVSFHEAGHILGASIIKAVLHLNGQSRTVLFTGDLGRNNKPIIRDPSVFEHADYILMESTYGDREHTNTEDTKEQLALVVNQTKKAGGNLVVPSFSIERSQEVLYFLNELLMEDRIPHIMTFLDSPMAVKVTEVFEKHPELYDRQMRSLVLKNGSPFSFKGLIKVQSTAESKAINHIKGTVMIIAGSGMCTGGRIKHHLVNNITRPESTILFVGYQANGTLGRLILDSNGGEVRILGQTYPVKARVAKVQGFSAHADRKEMLNWLGNLKQLPRRIFLVHGEKEAAESFRQYLKDNLKADVMVPEYQQEVTLD
ncbi:MAG: MBL fold metallo-hydrolase [Anaerohalosphaeraceae bacterium]